MNNQITKLIDILSRYFEISFDNNKVYELSVYISIEFALLSQVQTISEKDKSSSLYSILKRRYPKLIAIYESIQPNNSVRLEVLQVLRTLSNSKEEENAMIISDIYQHIKSFLLHTLISKKTEINKKTGKELLYQTQFFTDRYMVDYLLDRVFDTYSDLDNVLFVDPASGGGNFLAVIYIRLYKWYLDRGYKSEEISKIIFNNNILGYDLDSELSEIACLSLFMLAYSIDRFEPMGSIFNYGGLPEDHMGFLANKVSSSTIDDHDFDQKLNLAMKEGRHIVYVTNPPFMGKRDMDSTLKSYLQNSIEIAKGDMCFSFMHKIMSCIRKDDTFAVVAQNGWMNLSSLRDFRLYILNNYSLLYCIDLGSNAFKNINGEKTNVVLAIFTKKDSAFAKDICSFVNLRTFSLSGKIESLKFGNYKIYNVNIEEFRKNSMYEFYYQLGDDLHLLAKYPIYGDFAKCMQGTSTGDNQNLVKYAWEVCSPKWKLASKGGGFSKWRGLNIYKVKWGENGEYIKQQRGGVLRNPKAIPSTQLVFSDTGTLGLNVRLKIDNQVFIASGPGIKVLKGDFFCHMAFLNSKLASFLMKITNPKFTISGGYIQKLPVAKGILENDEIKTLAMLCVDLKTEFLSHKLPNAEFRHIDYSAITDVQSYIETFIKKDCQNMYERLVAERLIDSIILSEYELSKQLKLDYLKYMSGYEMHDKFTEINVVELDQQLSRMIGAACFPLGKKVDGKLIGSENCIEILSYQTKVSCSRILECIFNHVGDLHETIELYKNDLIHKLILYVCEVYDLTQAESNCINVRALNEQLSITFPLICKQLEISEEVLGNILDNTHKKVFFNRPILTIR